MFVWNISHFTKNSEVIIKNAYWSSYNVLVNLVIFQWNLNLLNGFSKNTQISNFMKIRPLGAKLFHEDSRTDRRTDMAKLIIAFHIFSNAPKNSIIHTFQGFYIHKIFSNLLYKIRFFFLILSRIWKKNKESSHQCQVLLRASPPINRHTVCVSRILSESWRIIL